MAKKKTTKPARSTKSVPAHHRHMSGWGAILGVIAFFALLGIVLFELGFLSKQNSMPTASAKPNVANPASVNCVQKGGKLIIENSKDGEYGVCVFEDNRQCEEWAMMNGKCPVGGIKVTGYTNDEMRYCAITGGTWQSVTSTCIAAK